MLLVLGVPGAYLSDSATEGQKETLKQYKSYLDQILNGNRRAIVLPTDTDENGNKFFTLEVYTDVEQNLAILKETV